MRLSPEKVPARIRHCAIAHDLGMPHIHYEAGKPPRLLFILGPFTLVLGCGILAIYNFYYETVFSWWPLWQSQVIILLGVAWLCLGIWFSLTPLLNPGLELYLCPRGLIYVRTRLEVIPWERIVRLWKEVHIDKKKTIFWSYVLERDDKRRFPLWRELQHIERLGGFIERTMVRRLLPQVIDAYEEGYPQDFSAILVSEKGIMLTEDKRHLPWSDLRELALDKTTVSIRKHGDEWDWAILSVAAVPNVGLLKGLVDHILQDLHNHGSPQITAYNAGFTVFFGRVGINKIGLDINQGETIVAWEEIGSVGIGESEVIIRRRGWFDEWYTIPIWMVNDLAAFKELVDYVLQKRSGS